MARRSTERITKTRVDATLPGPADVYLWDSEIRGFGLKVTPAGSRIYLLQYAMGGRGAPTRRYTIGRHGDPWTPDQARREALKAKQLIAAGKDPQHERDAMRAALAEGTVAATIDRYMTGEGGRKRTADERRRAFDLHVVPTWGKRPVATITRRDVVALVEGIAEGGAPIAANRLFALLRRLFNWAVEKSIIPASPCVGVKPPSAETSRDRVLTADELRRVFEAVEPKGYPFATLVHLLALTGQRIGEVAGMRWEELDLEAATWTIPAERAKNGRAHTVPLSRPAMALIEAAPRIGDYVLSTTGRTPVSGFSATKRAIDEAIEKKLQAEAEERGDAEVKLPAPWRFHDLRRTVATNLAAARVPPHVVERILNHASGTIQGVAAVYNRHRYEDEARAALDAWGARWEAIVAGKAETGKVVALVRG